jgi:hypothetical protein
MPLGIDGHGIQSETRQPGIGRGEQVAHKLREVL